MNYSRTTEWLGNKLGVNPDKIKLLIESNPRRYNKQPTQTKMDLADSVQYVHRRLGVIILGPRDIITASGRTINAGYESQEFRDFILEIK